MQDVGKSRGRRGYAVDFKQRALKRLGDGEASLRQVAKELKISVPTLIKWRKEENLKVGEENLINDVLPVTPASPNARERPLTELEMLRQEVERLKQERDRLRLGIAILAGIKVSR
jgi:transposase-like protein